MKVSNVTSQFENETVTKRDMPQQLATVSFSEQNKK